MYLRKAEEEHLITGAQEEEGARGVAQAWSAYRRGFRRKERRQRRLYLGKMEMNLAAGAQEAEGAFEEHWKAGLRLGVASVGKVEVGFAESCSLRCTPARIPLGMRRPRRWFSRDEKGAPPKRSPLKGKGLD